MNMLHPKNFIKSSKKIQESNRAIGPMSLEFANGPGDRGSVPSRVIPMTQKWYLMPPCLTQQYKVRMKSKVQ